MADNLLSLTTKHVISRVLHLYADWRIQATDAEKHCYKSSSSILLTFDDYGTLENVESILNILREKQIKAMFFIQGDWATQNSEVVDSISRNGHILGNHTYSHTDLLTLNDEAILSELKQGLPGPWFRAPMGRYNRHIAQLAEDKGFYTCYWTIDSQDWKDASVKSIHHTVLSELKPGAVVLLHLHGQNTVAALPGLIDRIRAKGYELTKPAESWQPKVKE